MYPLAIDGTDQGIIACGPIYLEDQYTMQHRIVMRSFNGAYVVHTEVYNKNKNQSSFCWGYYFQNEQEAARCFIDKLNDTIYRLTLGSEHVNAS